MKRHRRTKKRKIDFIPIIIVSVIFLVLILWFALQTDTEQDSPDIQQEIVIDSLTFLYNQVTFNMRNEHPEPADCVMRQETDEGVREVSLGIIGPMSNRVIVQESSSTNVTVECEWQDMDVSGCEATTFFMCNLVKSNNKLTQCLHNDIPYQHFCAALLSRNSSICDHIRQEPRKTHCKAYIGNEPQLCDNLIAWQRDWCYSDYAMNKIRPELCTKVSDEVMRTSCMAVVKGDIELCMSLEDNMGCIVHFVDKNHDISYCEYASNTEKCYAEMEHIK